MVAGHLLPGKSGDEDLRSYTYNKKVQEDKAGRIVSRQWLSYTQNAAAVSLSAVLFIAFILIHQMIDMLKELLDRYARSRADSCRSLY
jgi:hypothetical protein